MDLAPRRWQYCTVSDSPSLPNTSLRPWEPPSLALTPRASAAKVPEPLKQLRSKAFVSVTGSLPIQDKQSLMGPLIWFVSSVQESIFLRVAQRLPLCSTLRSQSRYLLRLRKSLPSPNFSQFQRLLLKERNSPATNMDPQVDSPLFTYWVTQDTHITFSPSQASVADGASSVRTAWSRVSGQWMSVPLLSPPLPPSLIPWGGHVLWKKRREGLLGRFLLANV